MKRIGTSGQRRTGITAGTEADPTKGLSSGQLRQPETVPVASSQTGECLTKEETQGDPGDLLGSFSLRSLDGIIIIDGQGQVLEWNKGEEEITGIPRSEAVGRPLWEVQYRLVPHEKRNPAFLEIAREKIFNGLKEGARLRRVLEEEIECPGGARRTIQSIIFTIQSGEQVLACGISRDITEHKKIEQEQVRQLERLTLEIRQAEDQERKRVSEILHGDVQQQLVAAKLHLAVLGERLKNDAMLEAMAGRIDKMVTGALEISRNLSHELNPPVLSQCDFSEALDWLAEQMKERHGLSVHFGRSERIELHSEPLRTFLFRAAQEMLFNVIKHARAQEAEVGVRRRRGRIYLFVSDNGSGFDPRSCNKTNGYGLSSVRQRARLLGGGMSVRSAPGKGSFFLVSVPDHEK